MVDPNKSAPDNFGDLNVENGGADLNGDVADAAMAADLDDSSGEAEMKALDGEDTDGGQADVTASGAE